MSSLKTSKVTTPKVAQVKPASCFSKTFILSSWASCMCLSQIARGCNSSSQRTFKVTLCILTRMRQIKRLKKRAITTTSELMISIVPHHSSSTDIILNYHPFAGQELVGLNLERISQETSWFMQPLRGTQIWCYQISSNSNSSNTPPQASIITYSTWQTTSKWSFLLRWMTSAPFLLMIKLI